MPEEISVNGDKPVSRRDCALINKSITNEFHSAIRQLKWFFGIFVTLHMTVFIFGFGMIQSSIPTEIPPTWFLRQVEKLEDDVKTHKHPLEKT